jgi:hypothetical protein
MELIGTGDQAGTWGTTTNGTDQYVIEAAIAGYISVPVSPVSNNQALTYVNGASAVASLNQAVYAVLKLTPLAVSANFNIFVPPAAKTYIIWNSTVYSATLYNSSIIGNTTAAGTGITIPPGTKCFVWTDGTNFFSSNDTALGSWNVPGALTVSGTSSFGGLMSGSTAAFSGAISSVSPSFTGTPTAITAGLGTNTTQIATTAFVFNAIGALGTIATQNANNVNITGGTITGNYGLNSAGIFNSGGWSVTMSGTKLFFSYNGTNRGSLDSSGNFIVTGNVTAFATP